MARAYGSIKTTVWEPDGDFRRLSPLAQWTYFMLVTQPQISNLGLLPFTPQKWVRFAFGMTLDELAGYVGELEEARFVIVDRETGELLVRTFVRHDGVWKQPKLVTNARKLIREVESTAIRDYLVAAHPWLVEGWDKAAIEAHETAPRTASETPSDTPFPKSGGGFPPTRGRGMLDEGSGAGGSSRPLELQTEASYAARNDRDPAAADLEAVRESDIAAAVERLPDSDEGTLARVLPLATSVPAGVFRATVERHERRVANGGVLNQSGLFVELLRIASRGYARDVARVNLTAVSADPWQEILADAHYYATRDYELPWDVAKDLLQRKIARIVSPTGELDAADLLDRADQEFQRLRATGREQVA